MPSLFDPLRVGDLTLPNRVLLAPLTRSRAGDSRIPNELMAQYYRQRASAGLILTEATSIAAMGVGYAATPGIWSALNSVHARHRMSRQPRGGIWPGEAAWRPRPGSKRAR